MDFQHLDPESWWTMDIFSSSILPCRAIRIGNVKINPSLLSAHGERMIDAVIATLRVGKCVNSAQMHLKVSPRHHQLGPI